jgi:drug/metabolite transporter (DMT)-like permease
MKMLIWVVNVIVALLSALNAVLWGYTIREVGDPQLTLNFLFKLLFNKWFIAAMASAFMASLLSYIVLSEMGILEGRYFLTLQLVAIVLASLFILGERPSLTALVGIILIVVGVWFVGYGK